MSTEFRNLRVIQTECGTDPEFELRCDPYEGDAMVEYYVLATIHSVSAADMISEMLPITIHE